MGDDLLDSMIGLSSNSNVSRHSLSSLDTLEVINAEMSSSQTYMEMSGGYTTTTTTSTPPAMVVEVEDEDHDSSSTGYLQDVLFEFTSKRRRLQLLFDDHQPNYYNNQHFHYWNENYLSSNFIENYSGNFGTLDLIANPGHTVSDTQDATSEIYDSSSCNSQKESTVTGWTTDHAHDHDHDDDKRNIYCTRPIFPSGMNEKIKRKRVPPKIVYPFALVKPGGFEGDATLNDINERILMPPTRPVRHPVGEFACRPLVSPQGPGLSGKAVVAFTRVHTQGRGTITIIRTRG